MIQYIPNQNLIIKGNSILCGDGTAFDFVPWDRKSRRSALEKANKYEYNLRKTVEQREERGTLTERQYRRAVQGQQIDPQPTGSVIGTSKPPEKINPYTTLLAMKRRERRVAPDYIEQLQEKEATWNAEHEAAKRRAELENTREYQLANQHAKATYRLAVNDPETNSEIVAERARLLKIAEAGDCETYWKTVAEKKLDDMIFGKPTEAPTPVVQPTNDAPITQIEKLPIDLEPTE